MFRAAGADRLRLGRDPFIPGGSQLDWAGSLAFLAPMPLRTIQALSRPTIVANENLFSHANLVSTLGPDVCQVLFSGSLAVAWLRESRGVVVTGKKSYFLLKKACQANGSFYNAHRIRRFSPNYYESNACS
jgi:hypothetical protein